MSKYTDVFPNKALLPVIHVEDLDQALRNVEIARHKGADGVFLIGHSMSDQKLKDIFHLVQKEHHGYWIGVNFLRTSLRDLANFMPPTANGIWTDNAGIDTSLEQIIPAEMFCEGAKNYPGLYFGGVAFKYQHSTLTPAQAAKYAVPYMDVITTSGAGTGFAPDVEKIKSMREAVGDKPLAIASGITLQNVDDYLPLVDCFLVATGISQSDTELDPKKVRELAYHIHQTA